MDEVDGNSITIEEPAPLLDHISESSLSSLPSTPPLPQSQFTGFYSSPPHISSSSNPLMTTTTSASTSGHSLPLVSPTGLSSLLFFFLAYCL